MATWHQFCLPGHPVGLRQSATPMTIFMSQVSSSNIQVKDLPILRVVLTLPPFD